MRITSRALTDLALQRRANSARSPILSLKMQFWKIPFGNEANNCLYYQQSIIMSVFKAKLTAFCGRKRMFEREHSLRVSCALCDRLQHNQTTSIYACSALIDAKPTKRAVWNEGLRKRSGETNMPNWLHEGYSQQQLQTGDSASFHIMFADIVVRSRGCVLGMKGRKEENDFCSLITKIDARVVRIIFYGPIEDVLVLGPTWLKR